MCSAPHWHQLKLMPLGKLLNKKKLLVTKVGLLPLYNAVLWVDYRILLGNISANSFWWQQIRNRRANKMIPRECKVAELLGAERGAPLYSVLLAVIAHYQLSHTAEQGRGHPSTEELSSSQLSSWHWGCCYRYECPAWIFQCSWCLLKAATEPPALNTESLESPDYFRRVERCIVWGKSSINRHNRTLQNGIIP